MLIEVRGAGFVNKGAELMLYAILERLRKSYPTAEFTMAPTARNGTQPFHRITGLGMYPKAQAWIYDLPVGDLAGLMPRGIREKYGLMLDREVDVVIDASGFAYGDDLGPVPSKKMARAVPRWKKRNTAVILLPQAFGPFRDETIRRHIKSIVEGADLVFARERESYDHLLEAVGPLDGIHIAPDFTNLISGYVPEAFNTRDHKVCLVPNHRMIDKTSDRESEAYLPFMIRCAGYLVRAGCKPFLLVHEGRKDALLAEKISHAAGGLDILVEGNPLAIKGILGACEASVGSRYHGLVSALSQGVPAMGTGWSHKYRFLFEDYHFSDGLLSVFDDDETLHPKLENLVDVNKRTEIANALKPYSQSIRAQSEEMWRKVSETIEKVTGLKAENSPAG